MMPPVSVTDYTRWLVQRRPFRLLNYGDGEWQCILGKAGKNCNGEAYDARKQRDLIASLEARIPGMTWYGSNPGLKLTQEVEDWVLHRGLETRAWVYKEIISGANVNGKLGEFIKAAAVLSPVLIGPEHLNVQEVHRLFGVCMQVIVPGSTAFDCWEKTCDSALAAIDQTGTTLVLACSGLATKPVVARMALTMPTVTIIDMGATLDPYAGVYSRKNYRKDEFISGALQKNIKDATSV